jgi:hypothetical protein
MLRQPTLEVLDQFVGSTARTHLDSLRDVSLGDCVIVML